MSAFMCADDSTHTINSNFACCRIEGWKHDFDLNFRRQRRLFASQYKQPTQANIGATTYFAMLFCLSPSEKRGYGELESAECPPPGRRNHSSVPVEER
jgi:hypothetical protein